MAALSVTVPKALISLAVSAILIEALHYILFALKMVSVCFGVCAPHCAGPFY